WRLLAIGAAALALSAASAIFCATRAPLPRRRDNIRTRSVLAILSLLGPVARSYARMRAAAARELSRSGMAEAGALASSGSLTVALAPREAAEQPGPDALNDALRYALFRRGLAVAGNAGGFEPFDLQIVLGPICRVALNS